MSHIVLVPTDYVRCVWETVAPDIERALSRGSGEYGLEHIRQLCESGKWNMWIGLLDSKYASVACTSIQTFPATRILYVHQYAGSKDPDLCREAWRALMEFGREMGCSMIQMFARRGWAKSGVLPEGWQHRHDVISVRV